MQRSELAHVLRASSAIANETSFVLIGSQAVLLLLDEPPPDLHDLTVSKCAAAREKDADYVRVLLRHKLVKLDVLVERIALLDPRKHDLALITQWTQRRAREATE